MARTRRVAVILHDQTVASWIAHYAHQHSNWNLSFSEHSPSVIQQLRKWDGDGVLMQIRTPYHARVLKKLPMPVVNLSGVMKDTGFPTITGDNVAIGRMAARHLAACGFRHFGVYGVRKPRYSVDRVNGFIETIKALKENDATVSTLIDDAPAGFPCFFLTSPPESLVEWLKKLPKPVGIFTISDDRGQLIVRTAHQLNLHVPNDVAVIGFNNDEFICNLYRPSLTSIAADIEREGREAVMLLDNLMSGKRPPENRILVPPKEVVSRESTNIMVLEDNRLAEVVRFIREHLNEPLDVNTLAEHIGMSVPWLWAAFKKTLHCTPGEYLDRQRVTHAQKLLIEHPKMKLKTVANACGLTDTHRLNALFSRSGEPTPRDYRRKRQADSEHVAQKSDV